MSRRLARRPSATDIADMGFCETKCWLKATMGEVDTPASKGAKAAGNREHERFHDQVTEQHNRLRTRSSSSDKRCFIATAVYGESDPRTEQLRQFRDRALKPTRAGRLLVDLYYRVSPSIADAIVRHAWMRRGCRRILDHVRRRIAPPKYGKERCNERDADP